jgi:fibronectin-binding autotransporter adhesin
LALSIENVHRSRRILEEIMRGKSNRRANRAAALLATACAAGLSTAAFGQTYTSWGDLGIAPLSQGSNSAPGNSPRQIGITVANNAVFGGYNISSSATNSRVFKATSPASMVTAAITPPSGVSPGIDKIFYNSFDGNLYFRSQSINDWTSGTATSFNSANAAAAGIYKMDTNLGNMSRIATPSALSASALAFAGFTYNYDNGDVILGVSNSLNKNGNAYYFKMSSGTLASTPTQVLQAGDGQNGLSLNDTMVYMGNGRVADIDGGNFAPSLGVFNYSSAGGTSETVTTQAYFMAGGASSGGITATLWDPTHESLHVMERMRTTGSADTLINTSFTPAAGQTSITPTLGARAFAWHASIPGASLAGTAAGDTNSSDPVLPSATNTVAISASALTPDGNILVGFSGERPYGVLNSQNHLWLKNVTSPDGSLARIGSNDTNNWTDLGVVDNSGNTQIVGLTTGNIGAGSLGFGRNSYDVWVVTQDRDALTLKLSSSASGFNRVLVWDTNSTTAGSGGPSPSGSWDGAASNFNTDLNGGNGTFTNNTTANDVVGFSAGADATGAYTVTVTGTQVASRLFFDRGAPTLTGGTLNVPTYDVAAGTTVTIDSDVAGNIEKRDFGTLLFTGTKTQTNGNTTTISNGAIQYAQQTALYNNTPANWTAANITVKTGATLALNVGGAGEFTSGDVATLSAIGSGSTGFQNGAILALDTTNAGGTFTHNSAISNANSLIIAKNGVGELVLGGNNTYTGGTVVNRGTLTGTLGTAFGSGPLTVNSTSGDATTVNLSTTAGTGVGSLSGTISGAGSSAAINNGGQLFTVNQTSNGTYPGVINGTGGLTKNGAATLALSGASNFAGPVTINAGTLSVNGIADGGVNSPLGTGGAAASDLVLNGGTLQYTGGAVSLNRQFTLTTAGGTIDSSGSGAMTLANTAAVPFSGSGARTLTLAGSNTGANTLAAQLVDGGGTTSLTKSGAGTWTVNNDTNSYTGPTTVNGGTLVATSIGNSGSNSAIGAGNNIVLNNGGIRFVGATATTTNRPITAGPGVISPAGPSGIYGANIGANNNANLGANATSTIDASGGAGASLTFSASSALNNTGGSITGFRKLNLTGSNTDNNTIAFNVTDGGVGSGSILALDKTLARKWVHTATNTYNGPTTVNGGTLVLQGAKPMGDWSQIGASDASGGGFGNQLFINNSGSRVELSTSAPTHLETLGAGSGTQLVLGGQPLNIYNGASGNGGSNIVTATISGSGGIYVGPQNNLGTPFSASGNGIPQSVLSRTLRFDGTSTYTGGTYIRGGNVDVRTLNGLGASFEKLEVSNLRAGLTGGTVNLLLNSLASGALNVRDLSGDISPASSGVNTMTINLGTGGQRILNVLQVGDTTYYGGLSGQNVQAGGGEFRLDPASTGTLTFVGSTASSGNATVQAATIAAGGMANGGKVHVMGGTLLLKTPGALSAVNLPASGPLTKDPTASGSNFTAQTGGAGVVAESGGTVAVNVGGPAPAPVAGMPVVGAEWTAGDVDRLKDVGTFLPGSMLGFDTTNAPGGTFTYASALGGLNINNGLNGATPQNDNTGMGVAKLGTGTLTLSGNSTMTGPTQVRKGTLIAAHANALPTGAATVANAATAQLQAGLSTAVRVASIATTGSGQFDITNNSMVLSSTTAAAVRTEINKSYNAGGWTGPGGLTSSTAAAGTSTGVGYADNSILGLTSFKGVNVNPTDVLVKYTYYGDADLDGDVDGNDVGRWATNFTGSGGSTSKTWVEGDWDYDGDVDGNDVGRWAVNFTGSGGGTLNIPSAQPEAVAMLQAMGFTVVPEPTGLALLGVAGAGLLARRRRRS